MGGGEPVGAFGTPPAPSRSAVSRDRAQDEVIAAGSAADFLLRHRWASRSM